MEKELCRTKEQQEYRNNLAHNLKILRTKWDTWKFLAKTLLESEKLTDNYISVSVRKFDIKSAEKLIDNWNYKPLVKNLSRFSWLTKDIAKILIEKCYTMSVSENLDKFEWLDEEIARRLLDGRRPHWKGNETSRNIFYNILYNLDHFKWLSADFADEVMTDIKRCNCNKSDEYDDTEELLDHLSAFDIPNLERFFAHWFGKLSYEGWWRAISDNLEYFKWLDYNKLGKEILDYNWWWPLIAYMDSIGVLEWVNYEKIANDLIDNGNAWIVAEHLDLDLFEWIDFDKLLQKLSDEWKYEYVLEYLDRFKWDHNCLARNIIKRNRWLFVSNLEYFKWLDNETAKMLIDEEEEYWWEDILRNIESFEWLDEDTVDEAMRNIDDWVKEEMEINQEYFESCIKYTLNRVDRVKWLDQQAMIGLWIETGRSEWIAKSLSTLQWLDYHLDYQKIAEKLISDGIDTSVEILVDSLDKIQWLDHQMVAESLIEYWYRELLVNNINKFKWLDYQQIAEKLIKEKHIDYVVWNPEKFWLENTK